jgi:transposase
MKMHRGDRDYLYEATSYRDENGKPRSSKTYIGRVDPDTGEHLYTKKYISRLQENGLPVPAAPLKPKEVTFTLEEIKQSAIKEHGAYYFLRCIAEQVGLESVLRTFVPHRWREYLTLAIYLICTEDPFMYCKDWLESTETLPVGSLSSQRVSELLHEVSEAQRSNFYIGWTGFRQEREYLALDITSVSSWSSLIDDVEWGYNRDKEDLPQINVCLLMGQQSRLPIFQTIYSGSLKDVSTLKTTLKQATCYVADDAPILLVMDKGFYSQKNVEALLNTEQKFQFIVSVPFTATFAKKQVESERKDIDDFTNMIVCGGDSVRGVHKQRKWYSRNLHTHIFFNALKAAKQKEELYADVSILIEKAKADPADKKNQSGFKKYLSIRASAKTESGHTVNVKREVLEQELSHAGWLVLISSNVEDSKEALSIYRAKDVVEKGFYRLKNSIDLGRLRVHSQNNMQNKMFIGFIALILMSHMNKVMVDAVLYQKMTMKEMLFCLKKLRIQYVSGQRILFPVTKEQHEIFQYFSIPDPM